MAVPKLRFPEFTDDWEQRKLGDLVLEDDNPVETPTDGYVRLGIRSHHKGTFHEYVEPGKQLETAKMFEVSSHHLIFNITFAWEEAWAVTTDEDSGKLVSHRFPEFLFNDGQYDRFYQYRLMNRKFKDSLGLASPGGAGRNRVLNKKELAKIQVMVPKSKDEQVAIGQFFDTLEHALTLHQRKLDDLKMLKKSMLQKMFPAEGKDVPEIRFPGFTDAWEQRKLSDCIADFIVPMRDKPKEFSGDIPWTRIEDIEGKYLNGSLSGQCVSENTIKAMNLKIIPKGSLIVSSSATFGVVAVVTRDLITNQTFIGLVPKENGTVDYWYTYFQSQEARNYMRLESAGSTIFYIAREKFENMPIRVPSKSEMKRIGYFFSNMDNTITLHQRKLDDLKQLKKALLQQMFV